MGREIFSLFLFLSFSLFLSITEREREKEREKFLGRKIADGKGWRDKQGTGGNNEDSLHLIIFCLDERKKRRKKEREKEKEKKEERRGLPFNDVTE